MFKSSRYNLYGINRKDKYYIYNTYSKKCEIVSKAIFEVLKSNDGISQLNMETINVLISRGFVVEKDTDEIEIIDSKYYGEAYRNDYLDITLVMTHACNFRCVYCYQEGRQNSFTEDTARNLMYFIKRQIEMGVKKICLSWFGGEPLLEKEKIYKIGNEIVNLCKENGVSYISRIITNGYLLTPEVFDNLLKQKIFYYTVTIDGPKEIHDRQRPANDGSGSYDTIIGNLIEIKKLKKNFNIDVRVNVSREIYENIDKFLNDYKMHFNDDARYNLVFEAVHDWKGARIGEHREVILSNVELVNEIYRKASSKNINLRNYLKYSSDVQICPASRKNGFIISGDGRVHKCEMAMSDKVYASESQIGYIDNTGKMIVDKIKEAKWITRSKDLSSCYSCISYPYCLGGGQCNYGMKFHHELRCNDNLLFLKWSSELLSLERNEVIC